MPAGAFRVVTRIEDQDDFTGALTSGYFLEWNGSAFTLAPVVTGISIGDPVGGGSAGDVLFIDALGKLGQDDTFFWDDRQILFLTATPQNNSTLASLVLGTNLSGGSANGTYLGINSRSGFTGDLLHLEDQNVSRFRLTAGGRLGLGVNPQFPWHTTRPPENGAIMVVAPTSMVDGDVSLFFNLPAVTGSVQAFDIRGSMTGRLWSQVFNTLNASGADASFGIRTAGASGGNPQFDLSINGVVDWSLGIANNDSDQFKIGGSSLGGEKLFVLTTVPRLGINVRYPEATIHLECPSAGAFGLRIDSAGSQTANLFEGRAGDLTTIYGTMSENGYWTTRKVAAPADAELATSEAAFWLDDTPGSAKIKFKAKNSSGTVVTGEVTLT